MKSRRQQSAARFSGRLAEWLCLAATPAFAIMALLTAVLDGGPMTCASAHGASALTGMTAMYVVMSVFHAKPWLKLIDGGDGK